MLAVPSIPLTVTLSAAPLSPPLSIDGDEDAEQVEGSDSEAPEFDDSTLDQSGVLLRQMIEEEMLEGIEEAKTYMRTELHAEITAATDRINDRVVNSFKGSDGLSNSNPITKLDSVVLTTIHDTITDGLSDLYEITDHHSNLLDGIVEAMLEKALMGMELAHYLGL